MKLSKNISAVITGGASGLGAAVSEILSSKNVKVTLFDSNEDKGKKQAKKISNKDTLILLKEDWTQAYLSTPHGKPVNIKNRSV